MRAATEGINYTPPPRRRCDPPQRRRSALRPRRSSVSSSSLVVDRSSAAAHAAGPPPQPDAARIALGLRKLGVVGSVLYVAAHPDDENTALLAYLANGALRAHRRTCRSRAATAART